MTTTLHDYLLDPPEPPRISTGPARFTVETDCETLTEPWHKFEARLTAMARVERIDGVLEVELSRETLRVNGEVSGADVPGCYLDRLERRALREARERGV